MEKNKTKNSLILASLAAIVSLGVFLYMFIETQGIYSKVLDRESELVGAQNEKFRKDTIDEVVSRTAKEQAMMESYFVEAEGVVDFIEEVEQLGRTSGLSIKVESVNTAPMPSNEKMENLRLVVSSDGGWRESLVFLAMLENLPYKSEIGRALVEKAGGEKGEWHGDYMITVVKMK